MHIGLELSSLPLPSHIKNQKLTLTQCLYLKQQPRGILCCLTLQDGIPSYKSYISGHGHNCSPWTCLPGKFTCKICF